MAERQRNARGEGGRLRAEVLGAAQRLLEQTGSEDAVSLRAIAREAGVSAPSIYAHFADGKAVLDALVATTFQELSARLRAAEAEATDPTQRLRAICQAYVGFGIEHPERYLTLFERRRSVERSARLQAEGMPFLGTSGAAAFAILAQAVGKATCQEGRAANEAAALLWAALHGTVTLRASSPGFPGFQNVDRVVEDLITLFASRNRIEATAREQV